MYTQYTIFYIKKNFTLNFSKSAVQLHVFFQGTKERVRNSRGKRAISVRATEVLLYIISSNSLHLLVTFNSRMNDYVFGRNL